MIIMNLILLLTMYPILLILYFSLANETKPKKNIILGATLPYTSLRDPRVMEICNLFKQTLRRSLILLALLPVPSVFIPYASIAMAVIFNWILVAVFIPMWIYAVYRRKLLSLKKDLMKDARIGIGSTVNMAHPVGKILMGFLILCLLALPLTSLWMIGEEFVPLTYQITDDTIQVSQLWQECQIPLSDIVDTTILSDRPAMSRIVGSSIGTLCKGRYRVSDFGQCRVYIRDPEGPYLLIITEDSKYLLEWTEELVAAIPSKDAAN